MPPLAPTELTDPLAPFTAGGFVAGTKRPIPLVSTGFDVEIAGGLAIVATERRFRNDEAGSIEATITFPVPTAATLFALEATIDGRRLVAHAERRAEARAAYENALERGKAAVLHEEVLRGVHMLSVGQLGPGAEIIVSTRWVMALAIVDGAGQLRIPLTVGDVYGRSGLADSDELRHGGPGGRATLSVRCAEGEVQLQGGALLAGTAEVPLDAPIDLTVSGAGPRALHGVAADGREVVVRATPRPAGDAALDVAILVDHSGSMGTTCSGVVADITQHQAAVAGLRALADQLKAGDTLDLWEFDDDFNHVGGTRGAAGGPATVWPTLVGWLCDPCGGTGIGTALAGVIDGSNARDILLLTDGKSYQLDVQHLAQTGRRISVVLIGEDSLDSEVSHLAALTGGDVLVASGADISAVLAAALAGLRVPATSPAPIDGTLERVRVVRGNAVLEAIWQPMTEPAAAMPQARAVAAFAAGLALPALDAERAAALAEAEGLVTHLTSFVLVDEAGATQPGLPAQRKIALPTPRVGMMRAMRASLSSFPLASARLADDGFFYAEYRMPIGPGPRCKARRKPGVARLGRLIDWGAEPDRLLAGDLSALEPEIAAAIRDLAAGPAIVAEAEARGLDPLLLVLALIATSRARTNRAAARIARILLGGAPSAAERHLAATLNPLVPAG